VIADRNSLQKRLDAATAQLETPIAAVDLAAFDDNAARLVARAGGKPVRVASKSVRCRALIERVLAKPGWHGVMAYTLREAVWLVRRGVTDDVLVAYPTVDRAAIAELTADPALAAAITIMVDHPAHLDVVDRVTPPGGRPDVRLCIDLDSSWKPGPLHVGVRRSPVHSAAQAAALARRLVARPGFQLVGMMSYEAQIAGLGDAPPRQALRGRAIRLMQSRSFPEIVRRRGDAVAAVRAVLAAETGGDLEFVNGGGTGSVAATSADPAVTEVTAGSGLYGPTLFDAYRNWQPTPAAFFALSVVRFKPDEGAGEVQTPLLGDAAGALRPGDRVWFRHAKAGELCEHVNELQLIDGDTAAPAPTYRGEGHAFLG
jgi:D-serine deaminase-like pyridoxal phosphate-dependent protein